MSLKSISVKIVLAVAVIISLYVIIFILFCFKYCISGKNMETKAAFRQVVFPSNRYIIFFDIPIRLCRKIYPELGFTYEVP